MCEGGDWERRWERKAKRIPEGTVPYTVLMEELETGIKHGSVHLTMETYGNKPSPVKLKTQTTHKLREIEKKK